MRKSKWYHKSIKDLSIEFLSTPENRIVFTVIVVALPFVIMINL